VSNNADNGNYYARVVFLLVAITIVNSILCSILAMFTRHCVATRLELVYCVWTDWQTYCSYHRNYTSVLLCEL